MELNKRSVKRILLIITFTVLLIWGVYNHKQLGEILLGIYSLISPFVIGLCIAYIVNVLLRPIENLWMKLLNKRKGKWPEKLKRPLCLLLTILLVIGIILAIVLIIMPELRDSVASLIDMIPSYAEEVQRWWVSLSTFLDKYNVDLPEFDFKPDKLIDILKDGGTVLFNTTASVAGSIVTAVMNFIIAFAFSIYVLAQKETLKRQSMKVLTAVMKPEKLDKLLNLLRLANKTFTNFITGQLTEAVIIGALCFIGMTIFRMPYAPAISVLVGFTALIPVFGAFIGTAVGAFLILLVKPIQAVWFVIFIIVLQQFEGNLIYPKVVGKSVGLPGIWVLVAVTVGGNAMGVMGMLISVPLCSVLYAVSREAVNNKLKMKRIKS
ncbi:MAG: AI-2E family transporter [Oscillospiraceae bacterium]|nr:AI-2E family transporter [Oscillospiraceae bacterium]